MLERAASTSTQVFHSPIPRVHHRDSAFHAAVQLTTKPIETYLFDAADTSPFSIRRFPMERIFLLCSSLVATASLWLARTRQLRLEQTLKVLRKLERTCSVPHRQVHSNFPIVAERVAFLSRTRSGLNGRSRRLRRRNKKRKGSVARNATRRLRRITRPCIQRSQVETTSIRNATCDHGSTIGNPTRA